LILLLELCAYSAYRQAHQSAEFLSIVPDRIIGTILYE